MNINDSDRTASRTAFHNLCALTYAEVKKTYKMELPFYWEKYNYTLYTDSLNIDFITSKWVPEREIEKIIITDHIDPGELFEISIGVRYLIDSVADSMSEELHQQDGIVCSQSGLREKEVPNEFIEIMSEFRDQINQIPDNQSSKASQHLISQGGESNLDAIANEWIGNADVSSDAEEESDTGLDRTNNMISADSQTTSTHNESNQAPVDHSDDDSEEDMDNLQLYLTKLINSYPEEYDYMRSEFLQWQSICQQLINNKQFNALSEFQAGFWSYFSRCELRIHHSCNLSDEIINMWKKNREKDLDHCRAEISSYRSIVMEEMGSTSELQSVSEGYNKAVDQKYQELSEEL